MESLAGPALPSLCHKSLPQPLQEDTFLSCPTMDLVAVASKDEHLEVYRFNGQRAFGLKRHGEDDKIETLCWKFNGHYIAVGWNDGSVDVVSTDNGETLKHFKQVTASEKSRNETPSQTISCIGWGVNYIDTSAIQSQIRRQSPDGILSNSSDTNEDLFSATDEMTLDDFLDRQIDLAKLGAKTSLPDQLALLDVQSILPKLPILPIIQPALGTRPVLNGASDIFSSQISLDAVIHNVGLKDPNAVDLLIICTEDGIIKPVLYDSLALGALKPPLHWNVGKFKPVLHAAHPLSCSHLLLVETNSKATVSRLVLVPITLSFVRQSGVNLHIVASRTAQLQNILQYLEGCIISLGHYWTHSQDLPSKFMRNVNETLEEKGEGMIVDNLYHLAVTGHCPATLKEWLIDELAERGHKRWEQAVSHGYSKILELTLENLLPAIDRCSIVLSRLRGLAIYHEGLFDISVQGITSTLALLRCFQLLGHEILHYASEERQQFATFSKWLRHEIDVQATDPTSSSAEETAEKDLALDYSLLLRYIQGALTQSKLKSLLAKAAPPTSDSLGSPAAWEEAVKALRKCEVGYSIEVGSVSSWSLLEQVKSECSILSSQITGWQTRNISMECGLILEEETMISRDMRVLSEQSCGSSHIMAAYIALVPKSASFQIRIHRIKHNEAFTSIGECVHASDCITLSFGRGQVKDIKFADDKCLLALLQQDDETYVVEVPYSGTELDTWYHERIHKSADGFHHFEELQFPGGGVGSLGKPYDFNISGAMRKHVKHVFRVGDLFRPVKLDINGRKSRRTLCVLSEGGRDYEVFDLDGYGQRGGMLMDTSA